MQPSRTIRPRSLTTTESKGAEEKEKTSELVESKLPAGEETEKEFAAHTVERVSVAIAVPTSWFTKIWQKRNPTPPGEEPKEPPPADIDQIRTTEIARIKSLVAGALPIPEGRRRHDAVRQDAAGGGYRLRGHHSAADSRADA